ncbi:MAG: RNA-binding protein [Spirochaetes bacterium]|nr:MAG: RNA-binding protein [Spirochaetota bacterium]
MAKLLRREREVVLPGEKIIESMDYIPGKNCFREDKAIISKKVGIVSVQGRVISVIPLSGVYVPRVGDMVIGEVIDIQTNGWVLDINSVHEAYLPLFGITRFIDITKTDLSSVYGIGDTLYTKISHISGSSIYLTMHDPRAKKFRRGMILKMSSAKVPRLIGRGGSMINIIKEKTGCKISVGQNGILWVDGENVKLVKRVIDTIEKEPHAEGLTEKISKMLDEEIKKKSESDKDGG